MLKCCLCCHYVTPVAEKPHPKMSNKFSCNILKYLVCDIFATLLQYIDNHSQYYCNHLKKYCSNVEKRLDVANSQHCCKNVTSSRTNQEQRGNKPRTKKN